MARLARIVVPDLPHHVTQRGNGGGQTFFSDADYHHYLTLLTRYCHEAEVDIWSWVLMPNHVHLILTPKDADGIRRALSKVHRSYAGYVHARMQRSGHFWQGRFGCVALGGRHLLAALRYVVLNPVRARLVTKATDWRWSSIHAHLGETEAFPVTDIAPVQSLIPDFAEFIAAGEDQDVSEALRRSETVGRPLGDAEFLDKLEAQLGRKFRPLKRGPKSQKN